MDHFRQIVLILSTLDASWLGMQAVHELGHVLGAVVTGGRVQRVALHPLTILRTDLSDNPHPLPVIWAGPIFGAAMPLAMWAAAAATRLPGRFLLRFFAGFCLVANGAYLGAGSFDGVGDCGDLLREGAPLWTLWLFGLVTLPAGIWLWHKQGQNFGLGPARGRVDRRAMYASLIVCATIVVAELAASWRT